MELSSLKIFVKNCGGILPEKLIRHVAFNITKGLAYLKSCNMLHRDVKPENILVNHDGSIKITDFGLLKHMRKLKRTNTFKGTRAFMSPNRLKCNMYGYSS